MGPQARNTSKITDCGRSLIISSVPATRYSTAAHLYYRSLLRRELRHRTVIRISHISEEGTFDPAGGDREQVITRRQPVLAEGC